MKLQDKKERSLFNNNINFKKDILQCLKNKRYTKKGNECETHSFPFWTIMAIHQVSAPLQTAVTVSSLFNYSPVTIKQGLFSYFGKSTFP